MKLISLFLLSVFVFLACGNPKPGDANEQVAAEDEVCETDLVTATYADSVNNGLYAADSLRKSVERETRFSLNDHSVTVKYSSPGVRGREIWGKLVPYDKVWAAGAHVATSIELSKSITIAGNELEEGKRIADALSDYKAAILQNHGLITVGTTIDEAVWWFVTMERSCQAQLLAMQTGKEMIKIDHATAMKTRQELGFPLAGYFQFQPMWQDICREVEFLR